MTPFGKPLDTKVDDASRISRLAPSVPAVRRGRPPLSLLERTRASVWAHDVQHRSGGLSFSKIERMYLGLPLRQADGSYVCQSHAWSKYANGTRQPEPNTKDGGLPSKVVWAETHFPGSAGVYCSLVWDVLRTPEQRGFYPYPRVVDLSKLNQEVRQRMGELARKPELAECRRAVLIGHLDAFAIILLALHSTIGLSKPANPELVALARAWMETWIPVLPGLRSAENLFRSLVISEFPSLKD